MSETTELSEREHKKQLGRALLGSTIGISIEWYDFFIYGIVTGLVFNKIFFPASDPLIGTLQAFTIFAVGFVSRPFGAVIFSHYGDRIGRRATLAVTLVLMGFSTFAVALVPSYDSIGVWAPVILTFLRLLQGLGVGGAWGGSALLAMEWAKTNKHRGFLASWAQLGAPVGLFLANFSMLGATAISGDAFLDWGWRLPFFASAILVGVGLYIRFGVVETPAFRKLQAENRIAASPVLEVIKRQPKEIILSTLARLVENLTLYVYTTFILAYGTQYLKMDRDFILQAVSIASGASLLAIPFFGWLSDRVGRKRIYLTGAALTGAFAFAFFPMVDTGTPILVIAALVVAVVAHDMMYGPQAAMIAESFTARLRYSGSSLGYQLVSLVAGGPAPIIATALVAKYNSGFPVSVYIGICAVISFVATLMLKDRTNADIDKEYDGV